MLDLTQSRRGYAEDRRVSKGRSQTTLPVLTTCGSPYLSLRSSPDNDRAQDSPVSDIRRSSGAALVDSEYQSTRNRKISSPAAHLSSTALTHAPAAYPSRCCSPRYKLPET